MTSMTVTATEGGSTANGILLFVRVLTGQAGSPIGAVGNSLTAVAKAITPQASGSIIYGAVSDNQVSLTAGGSTTLSATKLDGPNVWGGATFRSTAATTGGTPVTLGLTQSPSSPGWSAVEILAGAGLLEDASSPTAVSSLGASSIATAAFSPPAGALIVAMITCEVGFSGATTLSVTNTGGLTFAPAQTGGGGGLNYLSAVWTAVVPGGTVGSPGGPPQRLLARARRQHRRPRVPQAGSQQPRPPVVSPPGQFDPSQGFLLRARRQRLRPHRPVPVLLPKPPPVIPPAFPDVPIGLLAEILVSGVWTDITSFVYQRDDIGISRGRPDESAFVNPSQMTVTLNNRDGRFSYKNPTGLWFGAIGRNTPVRISVQGANPDDGTRSYRYIGELAEVPFAWDPTDTDRWVTVTIGGVLRRLSQNGALGTSPANLDLPLTAFIAGLAGTSLAPVAWWPCTDVAGSTRFASGVAGGPPMSFSGTPGLAGSSAFPGSAPVPTFAKSAWTGLLNGATFTPGGTTTVTDNLVNGQPWTGPPGVTVLKQVRAVGSGGGSSGGQGGGSPKGGQPAGAGGVSIKLNAAVTPGTVYIPVVGAPGAAGAPNNGAGGDGAESSFPADDGTVSADGGKGGTSSPGDGGTGTTADGGAGGDSTDIGNGGGGGGAGGQAGSPGSASGQGGLGANGGGNGGNGGIEGTGGAPSSPGAAGGFPGGGAGAPGASSTVGGSPGGAGEVQIVYELPGGGSISSPGGPQNANVLRFLLDIPAAGDVDGAPVAVMLTSGTATNWEIFYHSGIAVLSGGLGSSAITSIPVNPIPEDIPSGSTVTVTGSDGTQQFHTTTDAPTGSTALAVTSATPTISTAAGDVVTLGSDPPGYLQLFLLNSAGSRLLDTGLKAFGANGNPMLVSADVAQSGTSIAWTFQALLVGAAEPVAFTGTIASASVGSVGGLVMNTFGELDATAAGQLVIQYAASDIRDWAGPLAAWAGEAAGQRFIRLCTQQGEAYEIIGDPDATVLMGAQASDTFVNLLQAVETADRGQVYEPRDLLGLGYRTRASMQSQTPRVTLDYASRVLPSDPPLLPATDDQYTANIIVASRDGGSTVTVSKASGPLSTQQPPAGVGPYQAPVNGSLFADTQLADWANWLLNLGTANEYRYPTVPLRMERAEISGQGLWQAIAGVDVGDYIRIVNPPAWLQPDDIRQVTLGISETINTYSWVITLNAVPESPYEVFVAEDQVLGRPDTDGSALAAGIGDDDTTMSVATTVPGAPLWTTDPDDCPFDIGVDGERMTVQSVTGTTSPQAFEVTRAVNGVVKGHQAGAAVSLFTPARLGM